MTPDGRKTGKLCRALGRTRLAWMGKACRRIRVRPRSPQKRRARPQSRPYGSEKRAPTGALQGKSRTFRAEESSAAGRIEALDLNLLAAGAGDDQSNDLLALFDALDIGTTALAFVSMRQFSLCEPFETRGRQGSECGSLLYGASLEKRFHGVAVEAGFVEAFFAELKVFTSAVDRCQEMGDGERLIATR